MLLYYTIIIIIYNMILYNIMYVSMYTPHTHTHRELEQSGQSSQKNAAESAQLKDLQVNEQQ